MMKCNIKELDSLCDWYGFVAEIDGDKMVAALFCAVSHVYMFAVRLV